MLSQRNAMISMKSEEFKKVSSIKKITRGITAIKTQTYCDDCNKKFFVYKQLFFNH